MRWAQKKKIYLITFLLALTIFIRYEYGSGNPIRLDENWEVSPYPFEYNGSIRFIEEYINVTFDTKKADIIAVYTFENLNNTPCSTTILIPYLNQYNNSNRPVITKLLLDGNNLNYEWKYLAENFSIIYKPASMWGGDKTYYLVELKIPFEANETKVVEIHYTREYQRYDYSDNDKIYYDYKYFVGSARLWNQSIEKAEFNFWVPKSICDNIQEIKENWYPDYLGNNTSNITEYGNYYYLRVKYENWSLPVIQDDHYYIYQDFIEIRWKEMKPFYLTASFQMLLWIFIIPGIGITSLIVLANKWH